MDLSLLAAAASRPPARANGATEAVRGLSGGLRTALNLQALLPVLQARAAPLAREVAALARDALTAFVVEPPGGGALRIEIGRQFVMVPSTLRDSVLALVARQAEIAAAPAPSSLPASLPAPAALSSLAVPLPVPLSAGAMAQALSAAASHPALAAQAPRASRTAPAIGTAAVLFEDGDSAPRVAHKLAAVVQNSGLFFEAHVAQWAQGARSADALRSELAQLHNAANPAPGAVVPPGGQRVAAQLEVLQHAAVSLSAQAWPGQACQLELRRESAEHKRGATGAADPAAVFAATLKLDLPRLGPLEVTVRLAGSSVAVTAAGAAHAQIAPQLPALGEALQARGLNPAALLAVAAGADGR
jgi:hypothetical protein